VSSAPVETQLEKQTRLDFEAAEAAYRANMREQDRLFSSQATTFSSGALQETSASKHLSLILSELKAAKKAGWHTDNPTVIVAVSRAGYSPAKIAIWSCEDNRRVHLVYKSGKSFSPTDSRMYVQSLTISRVDKAWKVTDLASLQVKSFADDARCGAS
jgi:hypothetical protein